MNNHKILRKLKKSIPYFLTMLYFILLGIASVVFSKSYPKEEQKFLQTVIAGAFIISILIWIIRGAINKIRNNEKELNAIFHSMNSLIIEFDRNGRYVKIPPINSALLIRPRAELLNKTIYDVLPEAEANMTHRAILTCLKKKKTVKFEYALQLGNRKRWFDARVSWKSNHRVIFHAYDITEQKNAREELIKTGIRLKELNATKDKFFSIIAHDLKSPFNIIMGYSELLKMNYDDFDETEKKRMIDDIDNSSRAVYQLLHNLLLWARSQSQKNNLIKENLNLKDLVFEATEAYLPVAEKKGILIEMDIPDEIRIHADKFAIQTVIANLFDNAVKYTAKSGKIRIEASQSKEFTEVRVSDNGVGIPPKIKPKLFHIEDSISTMGTSQEKGTGLGLILCKDFIEKHGGTIGFESPAGGAGKPEGTSFYFRLPGTK